MSRSSNRSVRSVRSAQPWTMDPSSSFVSMASLETTDVSMQTSVTSGQ